MLINLAPSIPSLSNSRVTHEIERTLRKGANMPQIKHNKGKVLGTLDTPGAPRDGTPSVGSHDTTATSISGNGGSLARLRQSCGVY